MMSRQLMRSALLLQTAVKQTTLRPLSTLNVHSIHTTMSSLNTSPSTWHRSPFRMFCNSASALADDDILERIKKVFGEMERAKFNKIQRVQPDVLEDIRLSRQRLRVIQF